MLLKKASIATAVLAPLLGLSTMYAANADTGPSDVVSVIGSGTISPGLPNTGCVVSPYITFDGTAIFTPNSDDASLSGGAFRFDGSGSECATATSDNGSGVLSGAYGGTIVFTRTGSEVQVAGQITLNGEVHSVTANCEFTPLNLNPTTAYELACQAVLNS